MFRLSAGLSQSCAARRHADCGNGVNVRSLWTVNSRLAVRLHLIWLNPDGIVDGVSKALLAAEVPLGSLNAYVPEQELNLLQFATGFVAQAGARAAEVMRSDVCEAAGRGRILDYTPDHFGTETVLSDPARLIDCAKYRACADRRLRHPSPDCGFDPKRNWHSSHVTALAG